MTRPSPASAALTGSLVTVPLFSRPRRICPRLLKSNSIRWLPFAWFSGRRTNTSIEYSTMPSTLRVASSMSVITLLRGSFGSSTPLAVPRSFSYWPTVPKERPPNAGDCERASHVTLVMRASATSGATAKAAPIASAIAFMTDLLWQHGACLCCVDIALHVRRQQETARLERARRGRHGVYIALVVAVALRERKSRIAGGEALCLRLLERDPLSRGFAAVPRTAAEVERAQRPAGGGGDRRGHRRQPNAGDFVAVGVDLGDERRVDRPREVGRVHVHDALVVARPEVELVAHCDQARVGHARNAREAERRLRHETHAVVERNRVRRRRSGRHLAARRLALLAHPLIERNEKRAQRGRRVGSVADLLATARARR